jgi:hypothetical protein
MPAGVYDIYIEQGSTYTLDVEVGGIDLSTYLGRGQIRQYANSTDILASFTVAIALNTINISLTATQTALLPATGPLYNNTYVGTYDIELYNGTNVIRILNGVVRISPEVTK